MIFNEKLKKSYSESKKNYLDLTKRPWKHLNENSECYMTSSLVQETIMRSNIECMYFGALDSNELEYVANYILVRDAVEAIKYFIATYGIEKWDDYLNQVTKQ